MSIALAVSKNGEVVVAADSQSTFGERKMPVDNHTVSKVRRIGRALVASTGWTLYDNILEDYLARAPTPRLQTERQVFSFFQRFWKQLHERYSFVNDQPDQEDVSPFANLDSSFLVVTSKALLCVSSDMSVTRFEKFCAVGCGSAYALGAMQALYDEDFDAETIARKGCEAAITFDIHCGSPVLLARP